LHRSKTKLDPHRHPLAGKVLAELEAQIRSARSELAEARAEAERTRAECRQIARQMQARNHFLGTLSHELRTPLNAIIGFAELLATGTVPFESPKRKELLGHIETSGRHLLRLIDDVLALSKIDAGRYEFFAEPVDLQRLVAEALDVLHTRILRKRLVVRIEVAASLSDIVLDPAALKQAVVNYVSNAVRVTPEGGQIVVRARPEGAERFCLEVQDTGVGIAADVQPAVFAGFAPSSEGPDQRPLDDTGLELALTRRLVEAQGGEVGLHSAPGQGSTFWLVLDRVHPAHGTGRGAVGDQAGQPEGEATARGTGQHTGSPG
jgi:signal transduction histidine kinase